MDLKTARALSFDELRNCYREHLQKIGLSKNTIQTAYSDSFYLWRNMSNEVFWSVIAAENFEETAREALKNALIAHSSGNADALVNSYMSHLRRFRSFVTDSKETNDFVAPKTAVSKKPTKKVPQPTTEQVDYYLNAWDTLENYHLQEDALDKLFFTLCPQNTELSDVLLKVAALNDFYSTNIFSVYPVAKHILSLDIDARLESGDVTLVAEIQRVTIGNVEKNFYSFATKYCSHHNPLDFPIYDSYVDKVLCFFRDCDGFASFKADDLKKYERLKRILIDFRTYYGLESYNLKEIDKYLWQLGKEYFPKNYGKKR